LTENDPDRTDRDNEDGALKREVSAKLQKSLTVYGRVVVVKNGRSRQGLDFECDALITKWGMAPTFTMVIGFSPRIWRYQGATSDERKPNRT
jgi:hypothetical protein